MTALAVVTVAALALAGCGGASAGSDSAAGSGAEATAAQAPAANGFYGALLPAGPPARDFTLRDQSGRRFALRGLRGQIVILAFLDSSSRAVAPLIAQQIRGALDELGRPVTALAVSVAPRADTPAHVRAFLRAQSLTGRLRYLTGTPATLRTVWSAFRVVPAAAGEAAYERAAFVLLLDRDGAPRVELPLEQLTPEALAHDIRKLQGA